MHTNWCVLIEILMEIGMLDFGGVINCLCNGAWNSLYLNDVHSDGPKYIHDAYYTTVQPHSYYITNMFETKEQVPWVEIWKILQTPNSEFVFILKKMKCEHQKHFFSLYKNWTQHKGVSSNSVSYLKRLDL